MYTVETIENNVVKLENRNKVEYILVEKSKLPANIKEGDILDLIENQYLINEKLTKETKKRIKNKFNSLIN